MNSRVLLIGFSFFALSTCLYSSAPPCDAVSLSIPGGIGNVTVNGNLDNGSPFPGENHCIARTSDTVVLWYSINVPQGTNLIASTCDMDIDSDIEVGVFQGASCDSLQCYLGDNYASCSNGNSGSTVGWISSGETYYISVSASIYYYPQRNFTLTVSAFQSQGGCVAAKAIEGPYTSEVVVNATIGSTDYIGSTICKQLNIFATGNWFVIHPELNKVITISACSDFYGSLIIADGSCDNLNCEYAPDNYKYNEFCDGIGNTIQFVPTSEEYYIIYGSDENYIGNYELSIYQESTSTDIGCVEAYPYISGTTATGSIVGASALTTTACGEETGPAVWYKVENQIRGTITFSTCNDATDFDTVLTVYNNYYDTCSTDSFSCVGQNVYSNSCTNGKKGSIITLYARSDYYVVVSGANGEVGNYELTSTLFEHLFQ